MVRSHSNSIMDPIIEIDSDSDSSNPSKRILIVDDLIFNIQALESILENKFNIAKSSIDHALNGEEALEIISNDVVKRPPLIIMENVNGGQVYDPLSVPSSYALILMDCNMPFMDGFSIMEIIKLKNLESRQSSNPSYLL